MQAQLKSSNAEESSAQPLQLRHAASPSPDAAPSPIAAALTTDIDTQMCANALRQAPFNVLDTLLNGGGPVTETCSRRKLKSPPPRTKSNCSRHSKQKLPELQQPLLSKPSPANTPDAAEASDGHTHTPTFHCQMWAVRHAVGCGRSWVAAFQLCGSGCASLAVT